MFYVIYKDDDGLTRIALADSELGVSMIRDYETSDRTAVLAIPVTQIDDGTWRPRNA